MKGITWHRINQNVLIDTKEDTAFRKDAYQQLTQKLVVSDVS